MSCTRTVERYQVGFFLMLIVYCLFNLILRVVISPAVRFDEAEMVLSTQALAWGYGLQPPLYVWLQVIVVSLFGFQVFSLAILKSVLLFAFYLFVYLAARKVLGIIPALLATLCLFLIPAFVWEAVRSQTHTVLATVIAAAFLYTLIRWISRPGLLNYTLLGLLAGLGILSKYNFLVFLAAAAVALLTSARGRQLLVDWRSLVALVACVVIVMPHLIWLTGYSGLVAEYSSKLEAGGEVNIWFGYFSGVSELLLALLFFLGLICLALSMQFGWRWLQGIVKISEDSSEVLPLIRPLFLSSISILLLIVVVTGATEFRDRWLEPILFFSPLLFVAGMKDEITTQQLSRFFFICWLLAFGALSVLYGRVLLPDSLERGLRLNYPSQQLAAELKNQGFEKGVLIANAQEIAGSLKLFFPDSTVLTPDYALPAVTDPETILLCWNPEETTSVPERVSLLLARRFGINTDELPPPRRVSAPYLYSKEHSAQLSFVLIER